MKPFQIGVFLGANLVFLCATVGAFVGALLVPAPLKMPMLIAGIVCVLLWALLAVRTGVVIRRAASRGPASGNDSDH